MNGWQNIEGENSDKTWVRALQLPNGCLVQAYCSDYGGNEFDGTTATACSVSITFVPTITVADLQKAATGP